MKQKASFSGPAIRADPAAAELAALAGLAELAELAGPFTLYMNYDPPTILCP